MHILLAFALGPSYIEITLCGSIILCISYFFLRKRNQAKVLLGISMLLYLPSANIVLELFGPSRMRVGPNTQIAILLVGAMLIVAWVIALSPKRNRRSPAQRQPSKTRRRSRIAERNTIPINQATASEFPRIAESNETLSHRSILFPVVLTKSESCGWVFPAGSRGFPGPQQCPVCPVSGDKLSENIS